MKYSMNVKNEGIAKAQSKDVNASYKDLGAVCDAIRYTRADMALALLDRVIAMEMPVPYKRHNKHMGSRHELGGAKGGYPKKAAAEVKHTLVNAIANASNSGMDAESVFVIHAVANKTRIERRYPSKGSLAWGRGMYGRSSLNHSDIEYAKIEIGLSEPDAQFLTSNMRYFIRKNSRTLKTQEASKPQKKKEDKRGEAKVDVQKAGAQKDEAKMIASKTAPLAITANKEERKE
ncbi:MAG: 50S ribosomal protein L22, partial [Candidatus Micrarchaeota archaeon]|nr:50S ribosomal protein L22 [Candidatus Micrarchaeota archaeon]